MAMARKEEVLIEFDPDTSEVIELHVSGEKMTVARIRSLLPEVGKIAMQVKWFNHDLARQEPTEP